MQQHDDQKVKDYGVDLAVKMVRQMTASGDIRGLHFCTLNLEKSVVRILEDLGWVGGSLKPANRLITVEHIVSYSAYTPNDISRMRHQTLMRERSPLIAPLIRLPSLLP